MAGIVAQTLQTYLKQTEVASNTPLNQRVGVQITLKATKATLVQGRRMTVPIVLFLAVLIATLALAYVLENLRPSARSVPSLVVEAREPVESAAPQRARRGAAAPDARS